MSRNRNPSVFNVGCGLFPIYEVFDGTRYVISLRPDDTPIEEYIEKQRRYSGLAADPDRLRTQIRDQWQYLERMTTDHRTAN